MEYKPDFVSRRFIKEELPTMQAPTKAEPIASLSNFRVKDNIFKFDITIKLLLQTSAMQQTLFGLNHPIEVKTKTGVLFNKDNVEGIEQLGVIIYDCLTRTKRILEKVKVRCPIDTNINECTNWAKAILTVQ